MLLEVNLVLANNYSIIIFLTSCREKRRDLILSKQVSTNTTGIFLFMSWRDGQLISTYDKYDIL